jgi:hypothetical protein
MAEKASAQRDLEQQKLWERAQAIEARHALETARKAEKAQCLSQKQQRMQQQQQEVRGLVGVVLPCAADVTSCSRNLGDPQQSLDGVGV